eukprot:gene13708-18388_t
MQPNDFPPINPIPFPDPIITQGYTISSSIILIEENLILQSDILISKYSGNAYEIGRKLQEAIYGEVIHGILLETLPTGEGYSRVPAGDRAIKKYSKNRMNQRNNSCENPMQEISALQFIGNNHPNLIGQYECFEDDIWIYLIMRYIPGGEAFDHTGLSEQDGKLFTKQIFNGLLFLSENGIAHRDMSLENVLYDPDHFQFIIIDLGMCILSKKLPEPYEGYYKINKQTVCGKKNYMSPEILTSSIQSFHFPLCDIWAAGIMIFTILTGMVAIDYANDLDQKFRFICTNGLAPLVAMWRMSLSSEVVDLIQNMLRRDPQQRLTISQVL